MSFFYVWNGMLCTKYIIVFSLENSFPIVFLVRYSARATQHNRRTVPSGVDNNRIKIKYRTRILKFYDSDDWYPILSYIILISWKSLTNRYLRFERNEECLE